MLVRRVETGEDVRLRDLRLRALRDAPGAFRPNAAREETCPAAGWERRAPDVLVAEDGGKWLGMVGLYVDPDVPATSLEKKIAATTIERDGDPFTLAIEVAGAYAGDVTIWTNSHEHRRGEIGYILHPDFHGRGYAVEAARPLLELGFRHFGMRRVIGRLDDRNDASARVLEKLGMRREAHLLENEYTEGE